VWDQGSKEGGQTTPSWNAYAMLEWEHLYTDCHGGALHWMSAFHAFSSEWPAVHSFFFSVLQYASGILVSPCCMNLTISTPFLSQKPVAVSFLAGRQHLFKLFWHVWWVCVCIHCFDCSLIAAFTNETYVLSAATLMRWLRNSPSFWYNSKKVKPQAILCILCAPKNPSCAKFVIA
jgi:hypothetical protein